MGVWTSTPSLSLEPMCQASCDTDLGQGSHCVERGLLIKGPALNPHKATQGAGRARPWSESELRGVGRASHSSKVTQRGRSHAGLTDGECASLGSTLVKELFLLLPRAPRSRSLDRKLRMAAPPAPPSCPGIPEVSDCCSADRSQGCAQARQPGLS